MRNVVACCRPYRLYGIKTGKGGGNRNLFLVAGLSACHSRHVSCSGDLLRLALKTSVVKRVPETPRFCVFLEGFFVRLIYCALIIKWTCLVSAQGRCVWHSIAVQAGCQLTHFSVRSTLFYVIPRSTSFAWFIHSISVILELDNHHGCKRSLDSTFWTSITRIEQQILIQSLPH